MDKAFRSRVNIRLVFGSLSASSRLVLWRKFPERLPVKLLLEDGEMEELAKWEFNWREIKNAIKMVKTWTDCKGYAMNSARLESGIKVAAPQSRKI